MTPNARFTELITDITPSTTTNNRSSSAHSNVRNELLADGTYGPEIITTFLGGSYKRKTAIRPVTKNGDTERPDVDIYVVVKGNTFTRTPEDLIEDLFWALDRNRGVLNITRLKRNRCSIAVSTNSADMDVSPFLDRQISGLYRIGNRHTGEWYYTDPVEHTDWSARVNKAVGGRFNPMVKLGKWSRREFPTLYKHPKSIALEALIAKHMNANLTHYGELTYELYRSIVDAYAVHRVIGSCPHLDDPAIDGGNLLSGVSGEAFAAFYDKAKYFRDQALKGLEAEDQDVATKHWRRIFGSRFPGPVTKQANSSIGLRPAAAISPLAFPTTASRPPNRPEDFA